MGLFPELLWESHAHCPPPFPLRRLPREPPLPLTGERTHPLRPLDPNYGTHWPPPLELAWCLSL